MYQRQLAPEIQELAKGYPVVPVIGPRKSGKTTLIQHIFSNYPYVNLENPDIRDIVTLGPRDFLEKYPNQRVPKLLCYIQTIVDRRNQKGLFILIGSHQLDLHLAISQSLASRTALLTLLPMSMDEAIL